MFILLFSASQATAQETIIPTVLCHWINEGNGWVTHRFTADDKYVVMVTEQQIFKLFDANTCELYKEFEITGESFIGFSDNGNLKIVLQGNEPVVGYEMALPLLEVVDSFIYLRGSRSTD